MEKANQLPPDASGLVGKLKCLSRRLRWERPLVPLGVRKAAPTSHKSSGDRVRYVDRPPSMALDENSLI